MLVKKQEKISVRGTTLYPLRSNVPAPVTIENTRLLGFVKRRAVDYMLTMKRGQSFLVAGLTKKGNTKFATVKEWIKDAHRQYCRLHKIDAPRGIDFSKKTPIEFIAQNVEDKIPKGTIKGVRVWRVK